MLRITVDLVPFGNEERKRNLSHIEIFNLGKKDGNKTLYGYRGHFITQTFRQVLFSGKVQHERKDNLFVLLRIVISSMLDIWNKNEETLF